MNITIIGTGFVGVVSSAVFASLGNKVIGLDIDPIKLESLAKGKVPFFEPGLEELLIQEQNNKRLSFTTDYKSAISDAEVVIIAVGTPSDKNGHADLKYLFSAVESLAPYLKENTIVAVKSTVPPGTLIKIQERLSTLTTTKYYLAALPEFLREGSAVQDTLHPDRIVIGATEEFTINKLSKLHVNFNAPIVIVRPESAQMGKYTANAYLATRITFINQIADLCQHNGADIEEIIEIIGFDKRIGKHYWYPGLGYGGSCFPKDVSELAIYSKEVGENDNLLITIDELNRKRITKMFTYFEKKVGGWGNKKVAVLGLSFKPHTNDMREAPSIYVVPELLAKGAIVTAYDPQAIETAPYFIKPHQNLNYEISIEKAVESAEIIIVLTEWPEIINYKFKSTFKSEIKWFIDSRNQFNSEYITKSGYNYLGISHE